MKVQVAIIDAFIDGEKGGNPAGVVLEADNLSNEQKLKIAQQVGLSETAFVSTSKTADFKLDFFTPQMQIAHCGHATIATFSHLAQQGLVPQPDTSKETIDGNRAIQVQGDFAYMGQNAPKYQSLTSSEREVYQSLGLSESQVIAEPSIVNTGNAFLIVGVDSMKSLNAITPSYKTIQELSDKYDLIGFYVFTEDTNIAGRDASARMFAPRYGITEEAATGMAAGPLACYLHDKLAIHKDVFKIEQGYAMTPASPSCIEVVLTRDNQQILDLKAGGKARPKRFLDIHI